jgi:hypothetical protein
MLRLLFIMTLALFLFQSGANRNIKPPQSVQDGAPAAPIPAVTPQQNQTPCDARHPCVVNVIRTPDRTWFEWVSPATNVLLALVGVVGVFVAISTLRKIERQTAATEKQATHMVESERPFIMVETRGERGSEFWMRNVGKSPAQILFLDPILKVGFPEFVQEEQGWPMPNPPKYGLHYDNPNAEQINVQWLGPGDERRFATYSKNDVDDLPSDLKAEINFGHRRLYMYAAIKYRGKFSSAIYESRFCYGWSAQGGNIAGAEG